MTVIEVDGFQPLTVDAKLIETKIEIDRDAGVLDVTVWYCE